MLGIFSALGAASSWTYACYLWRKQTKYLSPSQINITKNIIAFIVFSPVLFTIDFQSSYKHMFLLFVSGIIGISIGDTFYILALQKLGTRRTLSIEALSPIFATISGALFLKEILPLKVWLGIILVSSSLLGVITQKTNKHDLISNLQAKKEGLIFSILSVFCAVIGATLSRLVLVNSDLNIFQTTEIRLLGSIIGLCPFIGNHLIKSIIAIPSIEKSRILYATFWGTNIGVLLQQNVFKMLPIGLGWTILSTSPIMALFFARAEGERINWITLLLTSTTIIGVAIVLL